MTEARGLLYTFIITAVLLAAGVWGFFAAKKAMWGCGSYTIETKPDDEIWACYVADGKCELVCAPLDSVMRAMQKQQQKDTI